MPTGLKESNIARENFMNITTTTLRIFYFYISASALPKIDVQVLNIVYCTFSRLINVILS